MNISVIGLGKLGAPLALVAERAGHNVIGIDDNANIVKDINQGRSHLTEPSYEKYLHASGIVAYQTDDAHAKWHVAGSDISFIVVPTPSTAEGDFSCDAVIKAVEMIGEAIVHKDKYHVVNVVSTVSPGSMPKIQRHLEDAAKKKVGSKLGLCYNPEFIALGSVIHDLENPDFVLIGESDESAGNVMHVFYFTVLGDKCPIRRMNFINAEISKIALNAFVTMKISFANVLARTCEATKGADSEVITNAIGKDHRIGTAYLKGGIPFGGPCFPRDNRALIAFMREQSVPHRLAESVDAINELQFLHLINIVRRCRPHNIAVLGLAYKPGTTITESSVGTCVVDWAVRNSVNVKAYDPFVHHAACVQTVSRCVEGADLIVLAHPQLATQELAEAMEKYAIIIDCWRAIPSAPNVVHLGVYHEYCRDGCGRLYWPSPSEAAGA